MFKSKVLLILSLLLALVYGAVSAQTPPVPIMAGENKTGEVSINNIAPTFSFAGTAGQGISIQVLAITGGFAPALRVLDPGGVLVANVANVEAASTIETTVSLAQSGVYTLEVQSANGAGGQFLIAVQTAQVQLVPPIPLPIGQELPGSLNPQMMIQPYSFTALPTDVLLLTVTSGLPNGGVIVTLRDAATGETLGMGAMQLIGARFRIPMGTAGYLVDISYSGMNPVEPYTILLEIEGGDESTPTPTPTPAGSNVSIAPGGACMVGAGSTNVNVRGGAGLGFPVVTQLRAGTTTPVTGRTADNSWYQVNINGVTGWVASTVVIVGGQCGSVPVVGTASGPQETPEADATATSEVTPTEEATPTVEATEETPTEETPTEEGDVLIPDLEITLDPDVIGPLLEVTLDPNLIPQLEITLDPDLIAPPVGP